VSTLTLATWQCLKVQEFVSQCNWENIAPQTSAQSVALRRKSLESWQCLTTKDFFALNNWSGKLGTVITADALEHSAREEFAFDMTLASGQFWQCFNWLGEKATPAPQKIEQIFEQTKEAIAAVEEFTLNDLSQLF
jgi:hypothetical protein